MGEIFPFYTFREFMKEGAFPPVVPVVEGFLNRSELALLSATAKTGKTWFGLHLAMSISKGMPFLGRFPTTKGKVLMVQTEVNSGSFQKRVAIVERNYGPILEPREEYPLISDVRLKLDQPKGMKLLASTIGEIAPSLVILDAWYTFHDKDESLAKDMAPLLTEIREIAKRNYCAILVVHHQGKKGDGNGSAQTGHAARGSSAFADVPDALLSLTRKGGDQLSLSAELRSQESPGAVTLRFQKASCTFVVVEGEEATDSEVGLQDYLLGLVQAAGSEGVLKTDLVKALGTAYDKSARTIDAAISKALRQFLITRKQDGHYVRFIANCSQVCKPLGDCELANDEVEDKPAENSSVAFFDNPGNTSASTKGLPHEEAL